MRIIIFIAILMICALNTLAQKMDIRLSNHTFPLNDSISFSIRNTDSLDVFFNVQLEKKIKEQSMYYIQKMCLVMRMAKASYYA